MSRLPNQRLKLPGADRSKGSGVFAPWRARPFGQRSCAGGRVARSLSAIRYAARMSGDVFVQYQPRDMLPDDTESVGA